MDTTLPWKALRKSLLLQADTATRKELHHSVASHWVVVRKFVEQLTGDSATAYVLVEANFSDNPEVTAEFVAERLNNLMSDDTARRKLNAMVRKGVALRCKRGRTSFYRLKPDIADAIVALMHGEVAQL